MKLAILLVPLFLAGCLATPAPIIVKFPDANKELMQSCPDLKTVDASTTKLTEVLDVVIDNYGEYYNCKAKVEDWIFWYNEQKKIFDKVK
jgi:hypothetical protein